MRAYFREIAEGTRIICTRRWWRYVFDYYSPERVAERLDRLVAESSRREAEKP